MNVHFFSHGLHGAVIPALSRGKPFDLSVRIV